MNKSESINELATALAKFQADVKQPLKNKDNPFFKSKFVPLENVAESITQTAGPLGLSFMQFATNKDSEVGVSTIVLHSSGQYIEFDAIYAKPKANDPQSVGSTITYLKRYSLSAAFGITSDEDLDGNENMPKENYNNNSTPSKPKYNAPSAPGKTLEVPKTVEEAAKIVFPFGKHVGKTLKEVFVSDKSYIKWLLESEKTDPAIFEGIQLMQVAIAQANAAKMSQ